MEIRHLSIKSLLFKNLGVKQTVLKNTFWLAIAEGIIKLLKFVFVVYITRILGVSQYGIFSFALAFISLFTGSTNLLPAKIVIREFAQEKAKEKEFSTIIFLRILLNLITLVLIFVGSHFIAEDPLTRKIILILSIYTFFDAIASFVTLIFESRQKMEYTAFTKIFRTLMIIVLGFLVLIYWPSVESLSYGYLVASMISLIVIILFFHLKIYSLSFCINKEIWKRYLLMSWPLALAGFFAAFRGQIDSVIMGYLNHFNEVGWYNAALKIVGGVAIPCGLISASFYPLLNQFFKESQEKFQKVWDYQLEILIATIIPVIFGGIVLAPKIITFFYGENFNPSIYAFQILLAGLGISFLHLPLSQMLIIFHHQSKIIFVNFIGAVVSITANLILIPRFGLYGAALTSLITAFTIWIAYISFVSHFTWLKILTKKTLTTLILTFFASGIMYFIISQPFIYNLHLIFSVMIGGGIYFFILLGTKHLLSRLKYNYFKQ